MLAPVAVEISVNDFSNVVEIVIMLPNGYTRELRSMAR